jgi:hypothetical protein
MFKLSLFLIISRIYDFAASNVQSDKFILDNTNNVEFNIKIKSP